MAAEAQGGAQAAAPSGGDGLPQGVVLAVEDVWKYYGPVRAVDHVSLQLREREILGIIGPNGAGKTTLLSLIGGSVYPDGGRIMLRTRDGRAVDVTRRPPHERVALGLAKSYQIPNVFDNVTVLDNMRIALMAGRRLYTRPLGYYYNYPDVDREASSVLERFGLGERINDLARDLSHGERKILDIALAYVTRPHVLLLDEPTSGLSVAEKNLLKPLLRSLRDDEGISLIIVEHDLDVVFDLADRVILMNEGRIILEGKPDEVRESRELRVVYLGRE